MIRAITKRQFDAYCYSRAPFIRYGWKEELWYEAFNKKLLGAVVFNLTDQDYGYVILGRDKRKVFRAIDLSPVFYPTSQEASDKLLEALRPYEKDGKQLYEQGDEKKLPNELLIPCVPVGELHPYFNLLISKEHYEAARNLLKEIVYSYIDVDGNYIKSFQTSGFDARLWELYLYVYLHNAGFHIKRDYPAPDYCLSYFDQELSIEACTVNPSPGFDEPKGPATLQETHLLSLDYMPIKFGSTLFSKLQKKYWIKEHVKDRPLILAIHDYHQPAGADQLGSMTWSRSALSDYLYGYRMKVTISDEGKLINHVEDTGTGIRPVLEKIDTHNWKNKSIPSGFFFQPEAEHISAVLFTNNATITAFNRMGKLAGLGSASYTMYRIMQRYNPDPYADKPSITMANIDDPDYEESWADGLILFHNPDALVPVDPALFPDISHMFFDKEKKQFYGQFQPSHIFASITQVLIPVPEKEAAKKVKSR